MQARGYFEPITHSVVGAQLFPSWPIRLSAGPTQFWQTAAPCLGEHNHEILVGELGISESQYAQLAADNIVGTIPSP